MDPQAVIDDYINNIAARLPRRIRDDVGLELRTLLTEHLAAAAARSRREPDERMAIEVARGFGRPEEVAARYASAGFQIIEPEHAPMFVKLSLAFVAAQWALTLPAVFAAHTTTAEWLRTWGFGALAWVGLLAVYFGLAAWIKRLAPVDPESHARRWMHYIFWLPAPADWRPIATEKVERRAELGALPLGVALTILFVAPAWFLGLLIPGAASTSWARYESHFSHTLLPILLMLMTVRLALCATAGIDARLRARLQPIRLALWVCSVGLLYWTVFGWDVFVSPAANALLKAWLLVFLIVNTVQIVVSTRRVLTRVRIPKALA